MLLIIGAESRSWPVAELVELVAPAATPETADVLELHSSGAVYAVME